MSHLLVQFYHLGHARRDPETVILQNYERRYLRFTTQTTNKKIFLRTIILKGMKYVRARINVKETYLSDGRGRNVTYTGYML